VLDFGLAKLMEPAGGAAAWAQPGMSDGETLLQAPSGLPGAASASGPTLPGMVVGTVGYMAPEQVRGEPADHRADLFALGCVLYEMATGRRPFGQGSAIEVMHAILKEQPAPLAELRPEAPLELQRAVRKAMAKDPGERYQNARDLAIDLRQLQRELDSGAVSAVHTVQRPAVSAGRRRPAPLVLGLAGATLVLALLVVFGLLRRPPAVAPAASMHITRLTTTGQVQSPTLSPDRKYVAYVVEEGGRSRLELRQLATGSVVQLVPPGDSSMDELTFTPDGNWLVYRNHGHGDMMAVLHQVPTLGGTPRPVLEDVDSRASFAPDGQRFAFQRHLPPFDSQICIATLDGSAPLRILVDKGGDYLTSPRWSPDGERLAVVLRDKSSLLSIHLALIGVKDGRSERLGQAWSSLTGLAWAPDGSGLYVGAGRDLESAPQIWFVRARDGAASQVTTDLDTYSDVVLSADGEALVAMRTQVVSNLWRIPVQGTPAENLAAAARLTSSTGRVQGPSPSPDGKSIAYMSASAGNTDLWKMDAGGGNARQLTFDPSAEMGPVWSPDGTRLAYTAIRDDSAQVWVMNADGTGARKLTQGGLSSAPAWSPDSRWIAYHRTRGGTPSVWKVAADGSGAAVQLTTLWSFIAQWSPDGERIACWAMPDQGTPAFPRLTLVPAGGGEPQFTDIRFNPRNFLWRWSPHGDGVTVPVWREGTWSLVHRPLAGGEPRPLVQLPSEDVLFAFAWMPDGGALVCERGSVHSDLVLLEGFRR
jgi:Tol biopolymer transport system component